MGIAESHPGLPLLLPSSTTQWEYLNTLIGWLAGWPVLQHLGLYSLTHARNHHAYNGNVKGPNGIPGDPDVAYQFEQVRRALQGSGSQGE